MPLFNIIYRPYSQAAWCSATPMDVSHLAPCIPEYNVFLMEYSGVLDTSLVYNRLQTHRKQEVREIIRLKWLASPTLLSPASPYPPWYLNTQLQFLYLKALRLTNGLSLLWDTSIRRPRSENKNIGQQGRAVRLFFPLKSMGISPGESGRRDLIQNRPPPPTPL